MIQSIFARRVHPVWFITWFCGGIICGIAVAGVLEFHGFSSIEIPVAALVLLLGATMGRRGILLLCALLAGMLFGVWRGTNEQIALSAYVPFYGQSVTVRGVVNEDTTYGSDGEQRLRLRDVLIGQEHLPGVVWASTPENVDIKRGDILVLKGQLINGFGNFPAALRRVTIVSAERPYPGDMSRRLRDWFAAGIRRAIPEPEASLSVGYLVGQRSVLPETLSEQLRIVGLTHAVVASGYNLTILVGFARRIFAKYSKYLAALSASTMIISFVLITGFSPSMTRAGLVSMLSLIAWYYGRSIHPVVLLILAAAITALWRPAYVWGDVGWYLSFTAFTGVILLAPLLQRYFWGTKASVGMFKQTCIDTIAAQLLTMPIILYSFGQYASYALLANILVLPLVPLAMLFTFLSGIGGLAMPGIAQWVGLPAKLILACNLFVISKISQMPGATGDINFGFRALALSYALLIIVMAYLWRITKYNFRTPVN